MAKIIKDITKNIRRLNVMLTNEEIEIANKITKKILKIVKPYLRNEPGYMRLPKKFPWVSPKDISWEIYYEEAPDWKTTGVAFIAYDISKKLYIFSGGRSTDRWKGAIKGFKKFFDKIEKR